jgi:hypothetical protein
MPMPVVYNKQKQQAGYDYLEKLIFFKPEVQLHM